MFDEVMRMRALGIIGEQVGIDPMKLDDDTTIAAIGADSLDCVEIGLELEEEFDIELPDEGVTTDLSVGRVLAMIKERWEA